MLAPALKGAKTRPLGPRTRVLVKATGPPREAVPISDGPTAFQPRAAAIILPIREAAKARGAFLAIRELAKRHGVRPTTSTPM